MEQGLNLALQFIHDIPKYKFPIDYEEPGDEEDREIITPRPGAETAMISAMVGGSGNERITIYWDLSYGAVLVKVVGDGEPVIKMLPGVACERELTPLQQIAELGITSVRILKYQLEFAKDQHGHPQLIVIQTVEQGNDIMHGCETWSTLVYNLDGRLLFEIGGLQVLRTGWMNWQLTPDGKWIILWQPEAFQPIIHKVSDLEARLAEPGGYWLRVDRLDWLPKISPFPVSNIGYIPKLTSRPECPTQQYRQEPITLEAYRDYLCAGGYLGKDEPLEESGYLVVLVNDLGGECQYEGGLSSDDFRGQLGNELSCPKKSGYNCPITHRHQFMIDLHRRCLIQKSLNVASI